ncbi:thioether cross-link-forming SCIFF peptide maturase [Oceanirhabdus seepicola]|uniref:Thioether cross-link-forming SCIFF peptide maturase n=1 Tax=Oceanirhabdus seepicola TaxID=2828781 RepID=A0A9J6P7G6_9CLOT|nr:thioether cross-link-forming SCIFF peptide maturase [Oceanirhabdus seepicola]
MALIHKFKQGNDYFVIDINSGSLHKIDELVFDILDDEKFLDLEIVKKNLNGKYENQMIEEAYEELKYLVNEGYLYSEELYRDIAINGQEGPSYIKALCLNIIHDCNLQCKYCFADEGEYHGGKKRMSVDVAKKAIDFVIKNSGPRKNIEVDLFGGEPLMVMKEIKEIVQYGREAGVKHGKNIRFTMTTNATLLNDEIIEYLNENMVNIILSLDGRKNINDAMRQRKDGTGSYDTILPKIKKMVAKRDKDKMHYVRGTFTRNNLDFFQDVKHFVEEGFKEISIEPVVLPYENPLALQPEDVEVIKAEYDKLYKYMAEKNSKGEGFNFYHFNVDLKGGPCIYKRISGCGAGHEYVAITPEGEIYPCHQFVGQEEYKMGTLESDELNQDIMKKFKSAHIYNKEKCTGCWARFYCSGGCQANNHSFNGDMNKPYELGCELQKKRIECAIALKALQMEKE